MKFSLNTFLLAFSLTLCLASQAAAQKNHVEKQTAKQVAAQQKQVEKQAEEQAERQAAEDEKRHEQQHEKQHAGEGSTLERQAEAEPRAVVSLCLSQGDVVVRGWDRGEVRARAEEAGNLRLLTPNVRPAPRVEVLVTEDKDDEPGSGDCGTASMIELMVPRGATVSIQTHNGHVEVSDVAEARIKALSGDVEVRRVSQAVEVSCLSGDISVSDSSGPVRLATISGVVEARNLRTVSAGDNFEAKSTSGDVTLERITHTSVEGSAISGNVLYTGALARGGSYDFRTISGDVTLELPSDASFNLHAKVIMSGDIDTDFPVKIATVVAPNGPAAPTPIPPNGHDPARMPPAPPVRMKPGKNKPPKESKESVQTRLDGTVGQGDAVVNLSSFSGSLHLRKQ
jgi:hypothetical protein